MQEWKWKQITLGTLECKILEISVFYMSKSFPSMKSISNTEDLKKIGSYLIALALSSENHLIQSGD